MTPPVLEIVAGGRRLRVTPERRFVIGRGPEADLEVGHPRASRQHVVVEHTAAGWTLTDHSRNSREGVLAGAIGALGALAGGGRDETIGYQHTEWVLRPGTPMYVLGEVHDAHGPLIIAPPADPETPFVLSTRSEEQLTANARRTQKIWAFVGAGLALAGVVVLALALL